jgi:choline kinase
MKAIILAAGIGLRLGPLTKSTPKCLLRIDGVCIIDRLLQGLADIGIGEVVIVVGYRANEIIEHIKNNLLGLDVRFVFNDLYESTNNIYSLWLARAEFDGGFIQIDSDVVLEQDILERLAHCAHPTNLVIDGSVQLSEEEMKVKLDKNGTVAALSKGLRVEESDGESIGVARISAEDTQSLSLILDRLVSDGRVNEYYETAYQELLRGHTSFGALDIQGSKWIEIDTQSDFETAKAMFAG